MRVSSLIRAVVLVIPWVLVGARAEDAKPPWVACGPAELINAIEPLAAYRRTEGIETLLVPLPPEEAIAHAPRRPDYLLIVGDETWPGGKETEELQPWQVRTKR